MPQASGAESVKFGTDGWRGIIAREFTFDNVGRVADALVQHLRDPRRKEGGDLHRLGRRVPAG